MAQSRSETFRRLRLGVLSVALALNLVACGAVGVSGGPDNSPSGITGPPTNPSNAAPQISGTPATSVIAGSTYVFTPTASDADGDALTFAISNMPDWATFDTSTGQLTGHTTAGEHRCLYQYLDQRQRRSVNRLAHAVFNRGGGAADDRGKSAHRSGARLEL